MLFVYIVYLLGTFSCEYAAESIDGKKLADELKKIKKDIGVDHMQEQFNNFQYDIKSDTGTQLLNKIQSSLETSLKDLNDVLDNVNSKIISGTQDSQSTNLHRCCDLQDSDLTYLPEFQSKVDRSKACVTTSPLAVNNLKYPTDQISDVMKTNYENNKNVLWQHYSTTEGVSVIYPATKWKHCQVFDPRFKSSYAAAASPTDKDVVLVIDASASMSQPTGVMDKTKIVLAKGAANNVLQTLKPNDRVGIVRFDNSAYTPKGGTYSSCYENQLAFATKENTDKLKGYIFSIDAVRNSEPNFENALLSAFKYYNSSHEDVQLDNREQIILFITDGISSSGNNPVQVISNENSKYGNKIAIFTYLLGQDGSAKTLLQSMANQDLHNASYGKKPIGRFEYFDQDNQKFFPTKLATFYVHLPTGSQAGQSTYTVPYVDPFSGVGLITSLCRRVQMSIGLHGVMCTDVKISKLLTEIEYFSEDEFTYAFMIDGTGRTLMHPLLPNAAFVKSTEDPVLVDIGVFERGDAAKSVIESMKSGGTGSKSFTKFFTKPRGKLVNDGSSDTSRQAHFFWGSILKSNFSVCVVFVNESYAEISESKLPSDTNIDMVFMYHNRSLLTDNFPDCKFYKRRVTLDRSCVKFSQAAFENPFQYLDRDETAEDVSKYQGFLTKKNEINPGFKSTLRSSVWATYKAEEFWKSNKARYVAWRYIATKAGLIRIYPGVNLLKSYDHEKRGWWRQAMAHPGSMFVTTPYVDAWGSGIVLTFVHTIQKKGSNIVTAASAADFPLEYFNWFITSVYPSCGSNSDGYSCIIIDDSGFVVMHPRLKETSDENAFKEPNHITVEEPEIANVLRSQGVLNPKSCQDYSTNKELTSYRVTLPTIMSSGLDFAKTSNTFELRPITETNLFIIRKKSKPNVPLTCTCDDSKSPDVVECKSNCNCLCHKPIIYDVCANSYSTESAPFPCSARLPDTSGVSEPDVTDGLGACYIPTCHLKSGDQDCFSEAECSWCKYTDTSQQIETPCCRLKEECTFGKTKSSTRDTCAPLPATPGGSDKSSGGADTSTIGGIIGGSIVFGILLTLIIIFGRKYFRSKYPNDDVDPYLDAVPGHELRQYTEKEELSSAESLPPPYKMQPEVNQNFYCDSAS
ncbi:VWFA and cache domain-containing protein 1-like [Mytilus edulis]|uniref:VWFA and cache domain-containing protein 1-like n=1 Tax=Mytilus edulis TaxID=6550 RepID=UPI0039EE4A10